MKKLTLLIIVCSLFSSSIFGQDSTFSLKNKWAMQFQLSSNFTLNSFFTLNYLKGSIISLKYHFSECSALRFGIGGNITDREGDDKAFQYDTLYYVEDNETDSREFSIHLQYIFYPFIKDGIAFFIGGGPIYTHYFYGRKELINYANKDKAEDYSSSLNNFYGLSILAGVEWFIRNNISLSGEYGFDVGYRKREGNSPNSRGNTVTKSKEINLYSHQVKLGVSVFF